MVVRIVPLVVVIAILIAGAISYADHERNKADWQPGQSQNK